jgi:ketol-acid reductoisomerase
MVSILSASPGLRADFLTGSQGHGQGLNMRDQGLNVIVGVRKNGQSWREAEQDGWVPGKNLFEIDEAISKGTIVMNLLSDAAQSETWPAIKPQLTKGKVCPMILKHIYILIFIDPLLLSRFLSRF